MELPWMRRAAYALAAALIAGFSAGCQSNEIPLIEFPKGAPPPPAEAKNVAAPQGANTSQGDPAR